jgi:hypothetical protein
MQIFPPASNALARFTLVATIALVAAGASGTALYFRSSYFARTDEAPLQPVPFTHKLHVGQMGFDCRYCHTSVEDSPFAGIPPIKTCMNCHIQIWADVPLLEPIRQSYREGKAVAWTRVYDLPDFVYFDHSIHVAKGVGCVTCHGRVDQMPLIRKEHPLFMDWCLECHRAPERFVRPREAVFLMDWESPVPQEELGPRLVKEYDIKKLTSCSTCHR